MTERDIGENLNQNLEYGRDLYVQLFQDESPLINLGYSAKQVQFTRSALSLMEREGAFYPTPKPRVAFGNLEIISEDTSPHVWLTTLANGGFKAIAQYPLLWVPDRFENDKGYIHPSPYKTDLISEEFPLGVAAVIDILPGDKDYQDVDELVQHLYEGAWLNHYHIRNPKMESPSVLNFLKSRFSTSVAVFRAGWVDENTKLELVVETDIYSRLQGFTGEKVISSEGGQKINISVIREVWRRLDQIEKDGLVWAPFGKKPNPSNQSIQKALEGKQITKSPLGSFVTNQ